MKNKSPYCLIGLKDKRKGGGVKREREGEKKERGREERESEGEGKKEVEEIVGKREE